MIAMTTRSSIRVKPFRQTVERDDSPLRGEQFLRQVGRMENGISGPTFAHGVRARQGNTQLLSFAVPVNTPPKVIGLVLSISSARPSRKLMYDFVPCWTPMFGPW